MWEKVIEFFISQGILGVLILCLGGVLYFFYKESKKERESNKIEIKNYTDKFISIATESVRYIQENTGTLKEMREEIKQHNLDAQEHRRINESSLETMLVLLNAEIQNRRNT